HLPGNIRGLARCLDDNERMNEWKSSKKPARFQTRAPESLSEPSLPKPCPSRCAKVPELLGWAKDLAHPAYAIWPFLLRGLRSVAQPVRTSRSRSRRRRRTGR